MAELLPARLWAVVTSSFPLRAYLFDGGVVVFGNTTPDDKKLMTSDDFIVNLWHLGRNTEAAPWSIAEFRTYLDNWSGSKQTFDKLWLDMRKALGTLASCLVRLYLRKRASPRSCLVYQAICMRPTP